MATPNAALLRDALAAITAEPERWDQTVFASRDPQGTIRHDLLGRAIIMRYRAAAWVWEEDVDRPGWLYAKSVHLLPGRAPRPALYVAMEALGLDREWPMHVFMLGEPDATLEQLERVVAEILEGAGEPAVAS